MPDWRVIPIRLGSLNTKNNQVRDFGRAIAMQNVDILKTNEITRRKGFIRRLEQQLAGPVRVLAPYGGICGRYPNYSDGGGTITAVGTNYWPPVQFTATKGASSVAMAWKYQDKSGARTTPGSGQSGVRIYRSTSDFIVNVDGTGATLVYSGTGTSFEDGSVPESGAVYYYSAHTIYSNYEGIVDQALIFAFAYALGTGSIAPTVPQVPLQEDSGDEADSTGLWIVASGVDSAFSPSFSITATQTAGATSLITPSSSGLNGLSTTMSLYRQNGSIPYPPASGILVAENVALAAVSDSGIDLATDLYYTATFSVDGHGKYGPYTATISAKSGWVDDTGDSGWTVTGLNDYGENGWIVPFSLTDATPDGEGVYDFGGGLKIDTSKDFRMSIDVSSIDDSLYCLNRQIFIGKFSSTGAWAKLSYSFGDSYYRVYIDDDGLGDIGGNVVALDDSHLPDGTLVFTKTGTTLTVTYGSSSVSGTYTSGIPTASFYVAAAYNLSSPNYACKAVISNPLIDCSVI